MVVNLVNQGQLDWKNLKRKILDELEIAKEDVKDIVAILASTEENAEFSARSKIWRTNKFRIFPGYSYPLFICHSQITKFCQT